MAVTGLASGAVITGFGFPVVAKYTVTTSGVTYTSGQDLARGVSVSTSIETLGEDNIFYANNESAEVAPLRFRRGTATLTVDGLLVAANTSHAAVTAELRCSGGVIIRHEFPRYGVLVDRVPIGK